MSVCMIIIHGSSINADSVEIVIIEYENNILFAQKYHYGYNISYDRLWADKEKPFIDDVIETLKAEYNVKFVKEVEGRNIFKETFDIS